MLLLFFVTSCSVQPVTAVKKNNLVNLNRLDCKNSDSANFIRYEGGRAFLDYDAALDKRKGCVN